MQVSHMLRNLANCNTEKTKPCAGLALFLGYSVLALVRPHRCGFLGRAGVGGGQEGEEQEGEGGRLPRWLAHVRP